MGDETVTSPCNKCQDECLSVFSAEDYPSVQPGFGLFSHCCLLTLTFLLLNVKFEGMLLQFGNTMNVFI